MSPRSGFQRNWESKRRAASTAKLDSSGLVRYRLSLPVQSESEGLKPIAELAQSSQWLKAFRQRHERGRPVTLPLGDSPPSAS